MNRSPSRASRKALRAAPYLAASVLFTAPASAEPALVTEPIPAAPPITGGPAWCSIAVDEQNAPHVAFGDIQDGVWYCTSAIDGWTTPEPIDPEGGIATGIALDGVGRPHVAYLALVGSNPDVYALKYARRSGGGWVVEAVESGVYPASPTTALALDAQGNPHLAYTVRDGDAYAVRYAHRYSGAWTTETIDASAWGPSLALDSAGRPHLAFLDTPGSRLVYGRRGGGGWTFEEVHGLARACALALDAADRPQVAFSATYQEILTLASKVGDTWVVETVDPTPNPGYLRTALAVASDGTPHVTATRVTPVQILHATRGGSGWEVQLLDGSAHDASIALDGRGWPHLAYTHYPGGGLALPYYARLAESVEVVAASTDTTLYENGVDVVQLTVRTRRYTGPAGPVTLSADLIPTIGPPYHAGDDAFVLAVGEEHVSALSWALPDSTYPWEFDLKVRLDDGGASMRSPLSDRFFRNIFRAAKLPATFLRQYFGLVVDCRQLDPETECLYQMASTVPVVGTSTACNPSVSGAGQGGFRVTLRGREKPLRVEQCAIFCSAHANPQRRT